MGLIRIVTHSSWCLGITLTRKNHRLKKEEANKIEAIVGLSDNLKTLVETLTKSRELESEGVLGEGGEIIGEGGEILGEVGEILGEGGEKILGEKILKIIKPLLWITRFSDSKLHVDLIDYEKRKGRPRRGRERLRDPNEILILYSECCFNILMESEGRILKEKEAPKQNPLNY